MNHKLILAAASGLLIAATAQAQLLIDRSGARQALYGADIKALSGAKWLNFDSKEKSLSLSLFEQSNSFFGLGAAPTPESPLSNWLYIVQGKVKATDGWDDFIKFDKLPSMELSLLVNHTRELQNGLRFTNVRLAYRHEEYDLFDPTIGAAGAFVKPSFDTVDAMFSSGRLWVPEHGRFTLGVSASVGYERVSNYEKLPKVEVSDIRQSFPLPNGGTRIVTNGAKKTRLGTLTESDTIPLDFTIAVEVPVDKGFTDNLPFVAKTDTRYSLIVAPYGRYVIGLNDGFDDEHGVGVTLTLKSLRDLAVKAKDDPFKTGVTEVKYPFSVFVERKNAFGDMPEWQTGVAVVWRF